VFECVGIVFVDIMRSTGIYTEDEIDDIIDSGTLNGIFVLGRTIGMIGHYLYNPECSRFWSR